MSHSLSRLGIFEVREKIAAREITAEEYISSVLEVINKHNPKINAYISVLQEYSIEMAKKIDQKVRENKPLGKLGGAALAIKDNISTKGITTTCGSLMLKDYIPPYDATVIEKIQQEDGIIIGKTNMDEFAMGSTTEHSYFGPTRNPWDLNKVPGGSSGGSAAAVVANMSAAALGSDTGGSIRLPAGFCGIYGLKPTYGLVSRYGLIAYACSLEQIGPFAKSVKDLAILLDVISGKDYRDSTSVDRPIKDSYEKSIKDEIHNFTVGIPKELTEEGTDRVIVKAIYNLLDKLQDYGVAYKLLSLPSLKYALPAYYIIAMSEASSNLARFDGVRYGSQIDVEGDWNDYISEVRNFGFGDEVKRRIILGSFVLSEGYFEAYYLKALKVKTLIINDFIEAFKSVGVLFMPVAPTLPFDIGSKISDPLTLYLSDIATVPVNLAGLPGLALPIDYHNGLPVSMQIVGPHFSELLLLNIANTIEKILGRPKLYEK